MKKMWQLCLIIFMLDLLPANSTKISDKLVPLTKDDLLEEFDMISSFLEKTSEAQINQSFDLYMTRITKLRKKKEIIIKKVYEKSPLVGELLALSNVEKIDLIVNKFFYLSETELLKKFLIMWDVNSNFMTHSAKVLLNLILCNNKFNRLRCILNLLLEGLCSGDDRSILIFKEIVVTVIIDTVLKTKFYYYNDIQAKFNLIKIFNKGFKFSPVIKIQFLETMLLSDKLKELLTFIIIRLKSRQDIDIEMDQRLHEMPPLLANNTKLFDFHPSLDSAMNAMTPEEKINTMEKEIEKAYQEPPSNKKALGGQLRTLTRAEAIRILENLKRQTNYHANSFQFKEKLLFENENEHNMEYSETGLLDSSYLEISTPQKIKLEEIKEELKNAYTSLIFNQTFSQMPELEEPDENYQIGIKGRSIYPKYKRHLNNLVHLNVLLDEFPPETPKGSINVIAPPAKVKFNTTISKEISPGVTISMQFKQKNNEEEERFRFKSETNDKSMSRSMSMSMSQSAKTIMPANDFALRSLQMLKNSRGGNRNFNADNAIRNEILNGGNLNFLSGQGNNNIKVLFPQEIHTTYTENRIGSKTIEINGNNPTKELIINKLLNKNEYNDLIGQQEKEEIQDPLGLYTVLKNIQSRKCSCGFLCIEIGTIYGNFDDLEPKNITIPFNTSKKVHMVIKPIIIVNNTSIPPVIPNADLFVPKHDEVIIDKDEDCDELKLSGNFNPRENSKIITTLNYDTVPRFKQIPLRPIIKRKFYRKVAVGENIYSKEIFKQGLNVIIMQRDKEYTKLYERTFDTNNNRKESDELAEILQEIPCSKIIVITGIGKWMGAMTPKLIKEIKQIGGPDLSNLYSPDEDDNTMADHAFILIGRRGLCRYNGIFRIKNFDLSHAMSKLFPDSSSDPNDCFFQDVSLDNNKNRLSEKEFFHIIDLRLVLNINNDNRFAWDAPTVSTVSPFRGSVHGGQQIKIGGFNFGTHTTDIREITVRGVICGDFLSLGPNLISCVTRASTILGPGPGNVMVKLRNGYESPKLTCNVFEYMGDKDEPLDDLKRTIITVHKMRDLPIYLNSNYHDNDVSIFDHLLFNQRYYKEKLKPDHANAFATKLDNMVTSNYGNLISMVGAGSGLMPPPSGGLRRQRFQNLVESLEVCDKDKK